MWDFFVNSRLNQGCCIPSADKKNEIHFYDENNFQSNIPIAKIRENKELVNFINEPLTKQNDSDFNASFSISQLDKEKAMDEKEILNESLKQEKIKKIMVNIKIIRKSQ